MVTGKAMRREKEEEYKERPETGSYVLNFKHLEKNY